MKVIDFIKENGIPALVEKYKIKVKDYEDRVVLNYDQIESPRFDPIVDECRALILKKNTWEVLARGYDRFYNVGEDPNTSNFPFDSRFVRFDEKIDGSLILVYWDSVSNKWQCSTRSCAYAEGTNSFGTTFADVFSKAILNTKVIEYLNTVGDKCITYIFELVSPETRVVTPYSEHKVFLTGMRFNNGPECCEQYLESVAMDMEVQRPNKYKFTSIQDAIEKSKELPAMEEGFVLVYEGNDRYWRLKCKNPKYLAIANMRANGQISPKRILKLIMANDHLEYLSYFESDKPYFDFVEKIYNDCVSRIGSIWEKNKGLETQKEFAISIMSSCEYDWEKGVLFELRKGKLIGDIFKRFDSSKLEKSMNLKGKFQKNFKVVVEEEV
jgi:hypothetical protein